MGTYESISFVTFFCSLFLFLTFLAAEKNKLINSFLFILLSMMIWSGGSLCMRMLLWPNYEFWFHISLAGIILVPYGYFKFCSYFIGKGNRSLEWFYIIAAGLCFLINVPTNFFIQAPEIVRNNGMTSFVYHLNWHVYLLYLIIALVEGWIVVGMLESAKGNKKIRGQIEPLLFGASLLFFGNMAIGIPIFDGFPIDILCGMLNAFLVFYALVRKHLFRLRLLVSDTSVHTVAFLLTLVIFYNLTPTIKGYFQNGFSFGDDVFLIVYASLFFLGYSLFSFLWRLIVKYVFVKDEMQQVELLKNFSVAISKTLDLTEIRSQVVEVIHGTMPVRSIYLCAYDEKTHSYYGVYSDSLLNDLAFSIEETNPIVHWLEESEEPVIYKDRKYSIEFKSMWESEKELLEQKHITHCVGIKEDDRLTGIILLSEEGGKSALGFNELQILESISSIASIAIKNARRYEQARVEARTDELTGLINRKRFYEILNEEYEKARDYSLTLMLVNVDDFKMFNQLYGVKAGDECLKNIADTMRALVGVNGYVARLVGKEFAILLPKYDIFSVKHMAENLCKEIYAMNSKERDYKLKAVTVSIGISSTLYMNHSSKDLLDHADLAVNSVKNRGKNGFEVYDTSFHDQAARQDKLDHAKIYQAYQSTIYALTAAIDAKDHYTFTHSNNVAYYSTELAKCMGMPEDTLEIIRQAALLHDVGKISIPEQILNNKGKLTPQEYEIIKGHVEASIGIVRHLPSLDYVIPAIIGHHERYDGNGYPRRIAGENIPQTARILCIADAFDAMTSKRPYKEPYSVEVALRIIEEEAGKQFDPELAEIFILCVQTKKIKLVEGEYSGSEA